MNALSQYKWDTVGLAETRWTGEGETSTEEGHKIWYSEEREKHQHGVAFIVRKEITDCVISCTPVNSRIISIRIAAKPINITVTQVYAPTTSHSDEETEMFYETLEETIMRTRKKDITIIIGDWNAKIGENAYEDWAGTVGKFGCGNTTDKGLRLLEFACNKDLSIANTLYSHKRTRRTWHSPDGKTRNQIDYILTPQSFKSSINKPKTRTFPGADVGSDHDLLMMTINLRLQKNRKNKNPRIRFNKEKLQDPNIATHFKATIGGRFAVFNFLELNINNLVNSVSTAMSDTTKEVLGKPNIKHHPWVSNDALKLCDQRRELKKTRTTNEEAHKQYRELNKNIRKRMRKAKNDWINERCIEIEIEMKGNNTRQAYSILKALTKKRSSRSSHIEDKRRRPPY